MTVSAPMREPLVRVIWIIAAGKVLLHALTSAQGYGYFGDELYYLACARHLDWGYVDHPPLSIALLAAWTGVFGDSLAALRMAPALIGAASVVVAAQLARELGGAGRAQVLTALIVALAPVNLVVQGFYSMNAVDILVWELAFLVIARLVREPTLAHWCALGLLVGFGLMNKFSLMWLGAGLLVGVLATPHRRLLATPGPWLGGALALAIFLPHVVWQWSNGFPTAEFMSVATSRKMVPVGPFDLLAQQALVMHPLALPVWVVGFFALWRAGRTDPDGPGRIFACIFAVTTLILVVNGTSRPNYLALAQPPLVAAGAIVVERLGALQRWRWLPQAAIAALLLLGLAFSPISIPVLPPDTLIALTRTIGIGAPKMENREVGALDPHFADMIGWEVVVDTVADAWAALPEDERARAVIVGRTYSETGAIAQLGRGRGLPDPVSPHNSYWHWGPGRTDAAVHLVLAPSDEGLSRYFGRVEAAGEWDCGLCLPGRNHWTVFVAREPLRPIDEMWRELRRYN